MSLGLGPEGPGLLGAARPCHRAHPSEPSWAVHGAVWLSALIPGHLGGRLGFLGWQGRGRAWKGRALE